ncbi:hypothetical protein ACH0AE_00450 [Sphingomonas sp. 179-A 2A2 NHS]
MMVASAHYLTSAEDRDGNVWVVRADDDATAHHVADLFRLSDHVRVTIISPDDPLDLD